MVAIITGSCGLVGSSCVEFFCDKFDKVIGIDNDFRATFFGEKASVASNLDLLSIKDNFTNYKVDIRDYDSLKEIFYNYSKSIKLVIHAAAQPSHDFSKTNPLLDFQVNTVGTVNLLELTRQHCPDAVFIFLSTNKVYGDRPNSFDYIELDTRFEIRPYLLGFDENLSIDNCLHTIFGTSKASADLFVQEYGKYFGIKTGVFRCGCITGRFHKGVALHGFLSYLAKCVVNRLEYIIYGWSGKQVRDNIHGIDLAKAFYHFFQNPCFGEVFNIGGGRHSNCSVMEAISIMEDYSGFKLRKNLVMEPRTGDHKWWITNNRKFESFYPGWSQEFDINRIIEELVNCEKCQRSL